MEKQKDKMNAVGKFSLKYVDNPILRALFQLLPFSSSADTLSET
jgi:hypothetical protein